MEHAHEVILRPLSQVGKSCPNRRRPRRDHTARNHAPRVERPSPPLLRLKRPLSPSNNVFLVQLLHCDATLLSNRPPLSPANRLIASTMDEPARKRRRTASPEEPDRPPSPWKNLPRRPLLADSTAAGAEPSRSPLKEPPRRPSASPTKATFDRGSSPLKQPPRRPSFVSPTKASLARNYPDLLPKRPPSSASAASKQNGRGDILARRKQARAFVLGEKDARQQAILDTAAEEEHADHASAGAEQLRLSKPQNVTPRARRTIRMGDVSEEDAELPSTPSQRTQEEQDTPRRGILFSSPSKKPPRLQDPVKPSPLRPKAQPVRENRSAPPEDGPVGEGDPRGAAKEKLPPDPELERRKQEKAHLMRELKELEGQVSRCTEEIVKIQEQSATHILQPSEREDLM